MSPTKYLITTKNWRVRQSTLPHGAMSVYPSQEGQTYQLNVQACRACIEEAAAGNPEAIAAMLMCADDTLLQAEVAALENENDK